MSVAAIELRDVSKVYDGTLALARVTHSFEVGRVHALMGRNGSGKSTLVKILAGAVRPTIGEVRIHGARVYFKDPNDAFRAGVITVHQELSVIPSLSVGENIYLGRLFQKSVLGCRLVDWQAIHRGAARLLKEMELDIDPRRLAGSLSVGQQQIVEIVKAMSFQPRILLFDEPTSALAVREVDQLFSLIHRLRTRGITVIYITHRINELSAIADSCTVLRDGRLIGTLAMKDATNRDIVEMMFADATKASRPPRDRRSPSAKPVLEVRNLARAGCLKDISFSLYPGEILGIAGMMGAGRSELLRAIFGADRFDHGHVSLDGIAIRRPTPGKMRQRGLGYTPENRKEAGLVQSLASHHNLCLASIRAIARRGFTSIPRETPFAQRQITDLAIKLSDPMRAVSALSGGNQQKIVIGNWLNTNPKVMLLDEPTRGVDIRAKQQIFEIIWQKAAQGLAVVFVSSELEELFDIADRILVLHHGRIVSEVRPDEISLAGLYHLCMEGA